MTQHDQSETPALASSSLKRLVVLSSYGVPCGIAQYAEHLVPALSNNLADEYEVEVAAVDVRLLKSRGGVAQKLAREHLKTLVERVKQADVVVLQLEPGLFGTTPFEIRARLKQLLDAAKCMVITHHTVLDLRDAARGLPLTRAGWYRLARNFTLVYVLGWLYRHCRQRPNKFFHIVQTPLDQRTFILLGIPTERVAAHPLAFLSAEQRARTQQAPSLIANKHIELAGSEQPIIIGVFGFLSAYKGIEVAVRAIDLLPAHYHLLIVGGLHPEGITPGTTEQSYIHSLLNEIAPRKNKKKHIDRKIAERLKRIHFVGHLDNNDFTAYMHACDAVVLPYAEVGQRSSGPASMALDLNKRVLCSRNLCFSQLNAFAGAVETFEIGNHIELAEKIRLGDQVQDRRQKHREEYHLESRVNLYHHACDGLVSTS
jgi:glycosyltransferase involved in cell wall biosynthesis